LELAFGNKSLRQLCENEITAKRQLGDKATKMLQQRLADLRAAASVKDVVIGRFEYSKDSKATDVAMEICDGCRVIFCPNHNTVPKLAAGNVDWSRVTRIKILRIEK
jgi:plasmid maintenance system killer protein